jgi:parallel beta-helix repeat protein
MTTHPTLIFGLSALMAFAAPQAEGQTTLYVSPSGSDTNAGDSPAAPFATPNKAEDELIKRGFGTVFLMGGTYVLHNPIKIRSGLPSQKWAAFQGQTPILDGGRQVTNGIQIQAANVTITGLTVRNFTSAGIYAINSPGVIISSNHVADIHSIQQNQPSIGIVVLNDSPNARILNNEITDIGYMGIDLFGPINTNLSGAIIDGNILSSTCETKDDCGAIYVSGRTIKSDGTIIRNNHVRDYGSPSLSKTFGIYLDDFSSRMEVSNNTISGKGSNPILLNSGRENVISGNTFTVSPGQRPLWVFSQAGVRQSDMSGNRFENNIIIGGRAGSFVKMTAPGKVAPSVIGNRIK